MNTDKICKIEWITIPANDLELAKAFYSTVFGFRLTPFSETFVVFKAGNINGGLDQDLKSSSNGIGFSITVDSINNCIEELANYNCEILREPYELGPNAGYIAKFKDPNGNVLELYSTSL